MIIHGALFFVIVNLFPQLLVVSMDRRELTALRISGSTIYAREEITLGNHVLVGANTKIIINDFHPTDVEARNSNDFSRLKCRPVHIGDNVFIGCNCLILKGTEIGNNSIVGAGSVVCGKFPGEDF